MVRVVVLLDLDRVVFEAQNSRLVIVYVTVVWRTENRDACWELLRPIPLVQLEAVHLHLMSTNYAEQVILVKQVIRSLVSKKIRAGALFVEFVLFFLVAGVVVDWVRPHHVGEEALVRNLLKTVELVDRGNIAHFRRYTAVNRQNFIIN